MLQLISINHLKKEEDGSKAPINVFQLEGSNLLNRFSFHPKFPDQILCLNQSNKLKLLKVSVYRSYVNSIVLDEAATNIKEVIKIYSWNNWELLELLDK